MRKYKDEKGVSEPFVRLPWAMLDSAAWKRLSTNAAWLYSQMLRHFRNGRFVLPFADVRWKLKFGPFDRARTELIDSGFIVILERHGLDGLATVYASSDKWKEISRAIMGDRTAGRVVRRLRRVNGEPRLVSEWEPLKQQSARKAESQTENLAKANAAKKGVRSSEGRTASRRTSPEKKPLGGPDKHSNRISESRKRQSAIVVPNFGNGSGDSRSEFGKRPVPSFGNDNAISTGEVKSPAAPKRRGPKPKEARKPLPLVEYSRYVNRFHAKESPQALKAELDAKGYEVPGIILRAVN
jgi:hypothetical protein